MAKAKTQESAPSRTVNDAILQPLETSRQEIAAYRKALREQTAIPTKEHAILARMLANYQVPLEEVGNFLQPQEDSSLPQPFSLLDMRAAVDLTIQRAGEGKKFAVWADYDADGNTSAAILGHVLESIGVKDPILTIPYRKEGFGLNIPGIRKLHEQGVNVLMVADSGTVAHEQIAEARRLGMDVIVLDHHRPRANEPLPDALVVNPNRNDDPSPHGALAAASVSYVFARDLAIGLREKGQDELAGTIDFDRLKAISAIGVVSDVVSLKDSANRYIVQEGLKEINSRKYPGLNALKDLYGGSLNRGELTAEDIAFTIGPGINAAGRLGDPMVGMRLLMAETEEQAEPLAKKIKAANEERKLITESITKAAVEKAEAFLATHPNAHFLMVEDEDWQAGVVGIVAGRLKEKYHLPTAVGHTYTDEMTGEKRTTYSIRSAEGVDFFDHAVEPILGEAVAGVYKIGGHAMAAGMTIRAENKESVREFIDIHLAEPVEKAYTGRTSRYLQTLTLDELQSQAFQSAYARMEPFGQGLRRPHYLVQNVQVKSMKTVGADKQHIQFSLGAPEEGDHKDAVHGGVLFRGVGSKMGNILTSPTRRDEAMDMLIDPSVKEYNGQKRVTFTVEDIAHVRRLGQLITDDELETRSGQLLEQRERMQAAERAAMAAKPRKIEDLKDENNAAAQAALKVLYEAKAAVLDTETTGLDAGADSATKANGLTQVAAISAMLRSNGKYAVREFNQPILPVTPAHFGWKKAAEAAAAKGLPAPAYDRKTFEYTITPDALAVTDTTFTRDRIDGPITGMLTGPIRQDEAKPFYEVASKVGHLVKEFTPVAYNAPFDMPVLTRHLSDVMEARVGHPEPRLNIPEEAWEAWRTEVVKPLLKSLRIPDYIEFRSRTDIADLSSHDFDNEKVAFSSQALPTELVNPAAYLCLMHGAMVHKGFGPSQRLQHVAPRDYGVAFTQDDSAHDALSDVGPLVYLFADQLNHFNETYQAKDGRIHPTDALSMVALWQHIVRQAVEEGRASTLQNTGDIILTFPEGTEKLKPFFKAFEEVGERNPRTKAYVGIRDISDTQVRLMGRVKDAPKPKPLAEGSRRRPRDEEKVVVPELYKTARHHALLKKTLTYQDLEAMNGVISVMPFDSSSKFDITLKGRDGQPVTLENMSISSLRPSAAFLQAHPEQLEAHLRLIQELGEQDRVGRVILEADGISLKGHHGRFGEVKFLTPLPADAEHLPALAESVKTHLDFLMKVGAIPGVHSTTRDMGESTGEETDEDDSRAPKEPVTYVKLGNRHQVLMEVRKDLLETVASRMGVDTMHLPAELPGGGIIHFDPRQNSYLIEGTVENFRDINLPLRDASWLLHRLNNLPGTFSQDTEINRDKVTLHCHDGISIQTLEILTRAHVAFTVEKDKITVPLGTLMNDAFHWSQEIGEHKAAVKANYAKVNPTPAPDYLQVLQQALYDGTVEQAYFGRDGLIWLSDHHHKNLPFNKNPGEDQPPRIVATADNSIDFDESTLLLTADVGRIGHKGLRYQLSKLGGLEHVPAQEVKLRGGRITLVSPSISPLQDTSYTNELRGLAEHMQSRNINPLLDDLRELMQSDAVITPHHDDPAQYQKQAKALVDWAEQHAGQFERFNKELGGLLDKELEFRFERGAHSIFDDVASLLLMEETLSSQGKLGKLPVSEKAAQSTINTVREFADGLEKLEFQRERVRSHCVDVQKRMLGFSEGQASRADSLAKTVASYYIAQSVADPDHAQEHDENARRWLRHIYPVDRAAFPAVASAYPGSEDWKDEIAKTIKANSSKINTIIAKETEDAQGPYKAYQLANQLSASLEKLWDDTRALNRSLAFHTELLKGAVTLDNRIKRDAVKDASGLLVETFCSNALNTLRVLENEGGVSDVRQLPNGRITFDASALLANPERWSNRLSELNSGTRARPESPYVLYDTSTLLSLLFAQENVPGDKGVGLLGTVKDLAELKVETPVLTDMVMAEFLLSTAPLTPEDVFRLDGQGRATGILYSPPSRTGEDYPKARERLEFLKDLYNSGNVRFMETKTAGEYLDTLRHDREIQRVYKTKAPNNKRLETLDDAELKALLLDHSSELSLAINKKIRQLGLRSDAGEVSIADSIAQLRREHGRELPVFVRYEGTDVRGHIIQRLNEPEKSYRTPIHKKYNPHNVRDADNRRAAEFDRNSLTALGEGSFQSTGGMFLSLATLFNRAKGFVADPHEIASNFRQDGSLQWIPRAENGDYTPRTFQSAFEKLLVQIGQGLGAKRRDTSIKDVRFADTAYNVKYEHECADGAPSLLHRHMMAHSDEVKNELTRRHMDRLIEHIERLSEYKQRELDALREKIGYVRATTDIMGDALAQREDTRNASLTQDESWAARLSRRTAPTAPSASRTTWQNSIREPGKQQERA